MRKVLITGAAGYLGAIMVPMFLARGWRVCALDAYPHGTPIFGDLCTHPWFEPVRGDVRDSRVVLPLLRDADAVVPLAALVGAPICAEHEQDAITTNTDAITLILRNLALDQTIVFPATDSGYPRGDVNEDSTMNPVSLYARTKFEAERRVVQQGGIALRLASVFGMSPQMRLDLMVNDFTWRAMHDGSVTLFEWGYRRNFVHVRDVATAFMTMLEENPKGQVFNVGDSNARMTKEELCHRIARYLPGFYWGNYAMNKDEDRRDCVVSNAKIEAAGWKPLLSIDSGIQELIKGYTMLRNSRWANT